MRSVLTAVPHGTRVTLMLSTGARIRGEYRGIYGVDNDNRCWMVRLTQSHDHAHRHLGFSEDWLIEGTSVVAVDRGPAGAKSE